LLAAIDGTGFQNGYVSKHYELRQRQLSGAILTKKRKGYPKATFVIDCASHLILGVYGSRGPGGDSEEFIPTLMSIPDSVLIKKLLADKGYDAERNHVYAREKKGIVTIIPARKMRPNQSPPRAKYRHHMFEYFKTKPKVYGQRWQVETTISLIKRGIGQSIMGQNYWSQCRDIALKAIVCNLAILAGI